MKRLGFAVPLLLSLAAAPVACSAGGSSNLPDGAGGSSGSASGGSAGVITTSGGTSGTGEGGACAQAESAATLVKEPVDIILVLDNSGSMDDEIDAVERNINVNFAQILDESAVDYRVILISRHRKEARDASSEASTSICVSAPLSGLATCPASDPVFGERFYHYFTKIESQDSFDIALDTYARPIAADYADRSDQAPIGWSEWLRDGAKKVFLELSDDSEDTPVATFVTGLQTEAPEHFGTDPAQPSFTFHSIVGVAEKAVPTDPYLPDEPITTETCPAVTSAGQSYQELSIMTGGLRFPICGFEAYDVVFRRIAEDVATRTVLACDFAIPPVPDGKELELDKVAVNHVFGDGSGEDTFLQAATATDCEPDAFYIDGGRIFLCPEACEVVRADEGARVQVLFTCESTIIVR
jgi:hypothetical protein